MMYSRVDVHIYLIGLVASYPLFRLASICTYVCYDLFRVPIGANKHTNICFIWQIMRFRCD